MTIDAIRSFIQSEILKDETQTLDLDEDLLMSDILDSLSIMRLVQHIETETGIEIPPEDVVLENFQTLRLMEGYLKGR